jgi:cytochrome c556
MQEAGTAVQRSASQCAANAKDASVTGDLKAPQAALARVNQTCVACHAGYRPH